MCLSWGSGVGGYTRFGVSGFHLEHLSVTRSQEGARRGTCDRNQPYHLVKLVTWAGYSQPICGDVEATGK